MHVKFFFVEQNQAKKVISVFFSYFANLNYKFGIGQSCIGKAVNLTNYTEYASSMPVNGIQV